MSSCCAASSSLQVLGFGDGFAAQPAELAARVPRASRARRAYSAASLCAAWRSFVQPFDVPRFLVQGLLARGELRGSVRQLLLCQVQLVVAHAQVLAQHLHLLRALGDPFLELFDALVELVLGRRQVAEDALALLELGGQRLDAFVAALDAALERLDVALAVDGLFDGLLGFLQPSGVLGF